MVALNRRLAVIILVDSALEAQQEHQAHHIPVQLTVTRTFTKPRFRIIRKSNHSKKKSSRKAILIYNDLKFIE